jgi:two-component system sensor histidine kinase KdpD
MIKSGARPGCIIKIMNFWWRLPWKIISRYIFAVLAVGITTGLLWLLQNSLGPQVVALAFLLPVVLSARLWGLGPGILSALGSFLCLNFFFLPPYFTFVIAKAQDLLAWIIFTVIAVVISQLLGQDKQSIATAQAREREATQLYEVSTALTGLLDEAAIAGILAKKICGAFLGDKIELWVDGITEATTHVCEGEAQPSPTKPDLVYPLATARGSLGKIHLWRKGKPFSESEKRLLSTFTSQGALALERARLVENESRSRALEESDRLKSALLSSVSHELRTPLATIKASISSLRSDTFDLGEEPRRDLLAAIEEETDHLNQLVGNILDMSRIETGSLDPQRKWNSLSEIVTGVLDKMSQVLQHHRINVDIQPDFPLVPVDYVLMEQVFSNLLSNSAKYAPPGTEITIRARLQADQTCLVQVINQGPPVDEEDLKRIFDKFYRVTAAEKITGTGLGLSICKGIIEAHGGRIWAENAPRQFIFNFTLPLTWHGSLPHLPTEV